MRLHCVTPWDFISILFLLYETALECVVVVAFARRVRRGTGNVWMVYTGHATSYTRYITIRGDERVRFRRRGEIEQKLKLSKPVPAPRTTTRRSTNYTPNTAQHSALSITIDLRNVQPLNLIKVCSGSIVSLTIVTPPPAYRQYGAPIPLPPLNNMGHNIHRHHPRPSTAYLQIPTGDPVEEYVDTTSPSSCPPHYPAYSEFQDMDISAVSRICLAWGSGAGSAEFKFSAKK